MAKISVRHGVAHAYGLLFGRPFSILGLTWLPALIYAYGTGYLIRRMDLAMATAVPASNGWLGQYALFYLVGLVAATALFGAVIAVPLTREALGLREERAAVHLVIGARELRLFWALIRFYALIGVTVTLIGLAAHYGIASATQFAQQHRYPSSFGGFPLQVWLNSVAATAAVLLLLSFAVRFGFFLDPVAAAETGVRLSRAKALARGNFWPIAAVMALAALPAASVLWACEATFGGVLHSGHAAVPADAALFAAILSVGLVVLHALLAGASAGVYAEMAEASAHEAAPIELADRTYDLATAMSPPATVAAAAPFPSLSESYAAARQAADAAVLPTTVAAVPEAPAMLSYVEARRAADMAFSGARNFGHLAVHEATGSGSTSYYATRRAADSVAVAAAERVPYVAARLAADQNLLSGGQSSYADVRRAADLGTQPISDNDVSYSYARRGADRSLLADQERTASYAAVRQGADAALPAVAQDGGPAPSCVTWLAPPPAAHFGTDAGDTSEPLAQAIKYAEAYQDAVAASAPPADVPDHAQHAEFPQPPLAGQGAMAVQAGFQRAAE